MKIIFGDFESYYDKEYTLKKMTPIEYILDSRWETIGCSIAGKNGPVGFIEGDGIAKLLSRVKRPWAFVSYNALFDACVLAYRYNIHPDYLIDTMGMVRSVLYHKLRHGRISLEKVAEYFSLPPKRSSIIYNACGYNLRTLKESDFFNDFKNYCMHDTWLLREITGKLICEFPKQELKIMDVILKMATRPQFHSDIVNLSQHLVEVINNKQQLLQRVGATRAQLLSADQFADLLINRGIDPPTKWSEKQEKYIYAFAKTDEGMQELQEHPNEEVQALVAARLGIKSTLEETRTQRFIGIGQATQRVFGNALMPIALRYGGAHTHRFSGEWKINQQNLPARAGKSHALKESLVAPPGHVILEVDAAQIEARLVAWLAKQEDLLEQFSIPGSDVYAWFGSDLFGYKITKKTHPVERFESKEIVLGLGFQMGPEKLYHKMLNAAREAGIELDVTLGQCEVWVNYYRSKFKKIKNMWWELNKLTPYIADLNWKGGYKFGPCVINCGEIILPSGLKLYYDELQQKNGEWKYRYGREWKKLYGGKITENIVQALDRQHVMEAAIRIEERCKAAGMGVIRLAHQLHDALIYIPPIEYLDTLRVIVLEEMKRPALWASGLPLDADIKIGQNYGELE